MTSSCRAKMYYSYSISPVLVPKENGIRYSVIPVYTENGSPRRNPMNETYIYTLKMRKTLALEEWIRDRVIMIMITWSVSNIFKGNLSFTWNLKRRIYDLRCIGWQKTSSKTVVSLLLPSNHRKSSSFFKNERKAMNVNEFIMNKWTIKLFKNNKDRDVMNCNVPDSKD
jgi:hypothetical protein